MSVARRLLLLLNAAMILVWITLAIVAYDQLPDTIATHFGASGAPDRFSRRSFGSWFGPPMIGLATTLLLLGLAHITHRRPDLYSIPGKQALLSLPPAQQQPFLEQMAIFMTLLATSMTLLFAAIQYDTWRVATSDQQSLGVASIAALALCLGGTLFGMPVWMLRFQRSVRAAAAMHAGGHDSRRSSS